MRYVALSVVFEGSVQLLAGETVIDEDRVPQKTGILNAEGVPIYRIQETVPIGFRCENANVTQAPRTEYANAPAVGSLK